MYSFWGTGVDYICGFEGIYIFAWVLVLKLYVESFQEIVVLVLG